VPAMISGATATWRTNGDICPFSALENCILVLSDGIHHRAWRFSERGLIVPAITPYNPASLGDLQRGCVTQICQPQEFPETEWNCGSDRPHPIFCVQCLESRLKSRHKHYLRPECRLATAVKINVFVFEVPEFSRGVLGEVTLSDGP